MDAAVKPRPPKLGPRKTTVKQANTAVSPTKLPQGAGNATANGKSRAPKLQPRKSHPGAPATAGTTPATKKQSCERQGASTQAHPKCTESQTGIDKDTRVTLARQCQANGVGAKTASVKGVPKLPPRGEGQKSKPPAQQKLKEEVSNEETGDRSLTTILNQRQRTQLVILLAAATATMRDNLSETFEATSSSLVDLRDSTHVTEDEKIMNPNIDPGTADVVSHDRERKAIAQREKEVSTAKMKELRAAAEEWFDNWREGVIGRAGEVLNGSKEAKREIKSGKAQEAKPKTPALKERKLEPNDDGGINEVKSCNEAAGAIFKELYRPVKTPLAKLDQNEKVLILHSILLLLLSMENYASTSRILLLFLMSSLDLSLETLKTNEENIARGLLKSAKELTATFEARKRAESNANSRKWKVGLASVAGAALVGVTGGMAAPLVAAGVGSIMGSLGLGATAVAGYLGSMASSTVLVGSLFGAYGGRMTGQMMESYAKDVSDFAFIPVHAQKKHLLQAKRGKVAEADAGKKDPASRRLRITIGISGWLTEKEEVVKPWTVLGQGSEAFALRWELEVLMNLGNAMTEFVRSAAWGYAQRQFISQTIFADLTAAMWPVALVKAARVVDNPFSVAKSRADKAGEILADALVNRAQGERPVNLIGYSLGARVIYACLMNLAARKAFGIIENVVLMGAPIPNNSADFRRMRAIVAGRLVNVFSENDYVLGFLYRTSSAQYGVAGLHCIEGVAGIENINVSDTVSGHLRYRFMVGCILKKVGFEDIDLGAVAQEEAILQKIDAEEKKRMDELKEKIQLRRYHEGYDDSGMSRADAEKEADEIEAKVANKTRTFMMQRGAELLHLTGYNKDEQGKDESDKVEQGNDESQQKPLESQGTSSYLSYVTPKLPFAKSRGPSK